MSICRSGDHHSVFSKGSELDALAINVVELAFDENESTRDTMQQSIVSLGNKEPKLLLSLILSFLKKSKKAPLGHRILLLNSMKAILKNRDEDLKEMDDFVVEIIKQVIEEMTSSKEIQPEWQSASSDILVTLSTNYCNPTMKFLVETIQPGVLPHFFVIQTLGAMAVNNPYIMTSYLCSIITQVLTMLTLAKTDNFRWVIANSMAQFCEAILEYVANPDRAPDQNVTIGSFSNYIFSAYEVFFTNWLNTKEAKLRKAVLDAIGNMVFIIERKNFEIQLPKLLSGIISQYKKHPDACHVTKALSQILQAATGTYSSSDGSNESDPDSESIVEGPQVIECTILYTEMENVINVLFVQLQQCLDATVSLGLTATEQLNAVRNQNEVKRCFTTLCRAYPDNVIASCLRRLEGQEKSRVSSLLILRHIISSCDEQLRDRHSQLISGLRILLSDNHSNSTKSSPVVVCSNNAKMQLAYVIIAMGGKNYLAEQGGLVMIEFLVRHCVELRAEPKSSKLKISLSDSGSQSNISNAQLRKLCENILQLGSSTVKPMKKVLWPYLMQLIVPVEYTEAVGTICCTVHNLFSTDASVSRDNDNDVVTNSVRDDDEEEELDPIIDYDTQVNIPAPQQLMARLIVLTGVPLRNNGRGLHILKAMKILIYNFHENLPPIWNIVVPKLISYLDKTLNPDFEETNESNEKTFDKVQWEELLLKLIAKSIEHINDEDWTVEFGEALGQQIGLYDKYPEERGFLFKCLGTIMANSNKKTFIDKHLDLIFHATRHMDNDERMGFAVGFGFSSGAHIDAVLSKLELYYKTDAKPNTGLMGMLKDKSDGANKEIIRASVLLAYGNALFYGPRELVPSRLESYVVKALQPCLKPNKEQVINRLIIEAVDLIARSVHAKKLCQQYRLTIRNELIAALLHFIESEPNNYVHSDIRALAMRTIGNLIILTPPITNVEMQQILNTCIDNIFSLPPDGIPLKKSKEMPFEDAKSLTGIMTTTMDSLNNLCKTILSTFFSNLTFNELFKVIEDRLKSDLAHVRERSLVTLSLILSAYYKELSDVNNVAAFDVRKNGAQLCCIGTLLGDLTPRLTDPEINNRHIALDCIILTLKIQMKLDLGKDPSTDQILISLSNIKERLKKIDSNIIFAAVNDIVKVICKRITSSMLEDLLTSLYKGLRDNQKHGASAVCVMLNVLFRTRFADLSSHVPSILTTLHDTLPDLVDNPKTGTLRAIKLLSSHYLIETLNTAMAQCLPLDEVWKEVLVSTINEESMLERALVHLTELLVRTMPFEEREDPSQRKVKGQQTKMIRYSCHTWLAAMNCIQILCVNSIECGNQCLTRMYSKMLTSILVACASSIICTPFTGKSHEKKSGLEANLFAGVRPITICDEALRNFLVTTQTHEIIEELNVRCGWEKLEKEEQFMEFVSLISKSICENKSSEIVNIVTNLGQYSNSNYEQHRILVAGFYGSVIAHSAVSSSDSLLDSVINLLLSKLGDKSIEVRRLSLVGMGNVGKCNEAIVQRHATSLMSALLMGMDDRQDSEDKLINAAMDGLANLVVKLTEKDVRDVLMTICLRMLSCYERESPNVRASAFRLFGSLAKLASGRSYQRYISEIDSVLVSLLVHLEDPSSDVIRACKSTLKQIMPIYCSTTTEEEQLTVPNKLNDLIQSCLREDSVLHYGEFCNDLSKCFVSEMPTKVNDIIMRLLAYFQSDCPELAASSVLLIGFLMTNLEEEQKLNLQRGQICSELIQLMRSKNAKVRARTAEAISLLHMY